MRSFAATANRTSGLRVGTAPCGARRSQGFRPHHVSNRETADSHSAFCEPGGALRPRPQNRRAAAAGQIPRASALLKPVSPCVGAPLGSLILKAMFLQRFEVPPNYTGLLLKEMRLHTLLGPGMYRYRSWRRVYSMIKVPTIAQMAYVMGQEALSADRIALRFSYYLIYQVADAKRLFEAFDLMTAAPMAQVHDRLHRLSQPLLRDRIAAKDAETLLEDRLAITTGTQEALAESFTPLGVSILSLQLVDLSFPRTIQDIFAKRLEAKVRAQVELENARSQVATARTLKNAAELLKGDPEIRYLQYLETLQTIAAKGKHTFVLSQAPPTLGLGA